MFLVYHLTDVIIPCAFFKSKENLPKATLQTSSDTSLVSLSHGPISNQSQQGSKINMIWLVFIRIHALGLVRNPASPKARGHLVAEQKQLLFVRNKEGNSS